MRNILFHFSTSSPCISEESVWAVLPTWFGAAAEEGSPSDPYLAYSPQLLLLFFIDALGHYPLAQWARFLRPVVQDQCCIVVEVIHTAVTPKSGDGMLSHDMVSVPGRRSDWGRKDGK